MVAYIIEYFKVAKNKAGITPRSTSWILSLGFGVIGIISVSANTMLLISPKPDWGR